MGLKRRNITQLSALVVYILITLLFFVGWNKVIYEEANPGTVILIITVGYFFGGALLFPLAWFGIILFKQLKLKTDMPVKEAFTISVFLNKYLFFLANFLNIIITYIFMRKFDAGNLYIPFIFLYYLIFTGVIFVFAVLTHFAISKKLDVKKNIIAFAIMGFIAVLWGLNMFSYTDIWDPANGDTTFLYMLSNKQVYKFIIYLGIIHIFSGLIIVFNIKDRLKLLTLYLNLTILIINIYNFLFMVSFFNALEQI